jgi:hypothetical protein
MKNISFLTFLAILAINTVSAQDQGTKRKSKTHKKSSHKKKLNKTEQLRKHILSCGAKQKPSHTHNLVKLIQDPAVDINASDKKGNTILMNAMLILMPIRAFSSLAEERKRLHNKYCGANLQDMILAGLDNPDLDINHANNDGDTLFMLAMAESGLSKKLRHEIFDKIFALDPNLSQKNKHEWTALTHAVHLATLGALGPNVTNTPGFDTMDTYFLNKLLAAGARVGKADMEIAMEAVKYANHIIRGNPKTSGMIKKANFILALLKNKQKEQAKGRKKNRTR